MKKFFIISSILLTVFALSVSCSFSDGKVTLEDAKNTGDAVFVFETKNQEPIVDKIEYKSGELTIYNGEKQEKYPIEIKGRGNSTWNLAKKPFNFKIFNEQGEKNEVKILGMKKSNKWVLLANHTDKTLIRNWFASRLGQVFNTVWNPSMEFAHVFLNDEYLGYYNVSEKVEIGDNRVDIKKIKTDKPDRGYLLEVDFRLSEPFNFITKQGVPFCLKDPDADDLDDNCFEKIKEKIQEIEDYIYSEEYRASSLNDVKHIDVDSFADWYIINELTKNTDAAMNASCYMYYDGTKLHMGPIWDFDLSCGNAGFDETQDPEGFYIKDAKWFSELFKNKEFVANVWNRWDTKRIKLLDVIEETLEKAENIKDSVNLNMRTWPVLGTYVWPSPEGFMERRTYQAELDMFTDFIEKRFGWLDINLYTLMTD